MYFFIQYFLCDWCCILFLKLEPVDIEYGATTNLEFMNETVKWITLLSKCNVSFIILFKYGTEYNMEYIFRVKTFSINIWRTALSFFSCFCISFILDFPCFELSLTRPLMASAVSYCTRVQKWKYEIYSPSLSQSNCL